MIEEWRRKLRLWWALYGEDEAWRFVATIATFAAAFTVGSLIDRAMKRKRNRAETEDDGD